MTVASLEHQIWHKLSLHLRIEYREYNSAYKQIHHLIFSQLLEGIQTGLPGLSVVSHVVMELNSATDLATTRNLETMKQHARDLLRKHAYVPLKYVQRQVNI